MTYTVSLRSVLDRFVTTCFRVKKHLEELYVDFVEDQKFSRVGLRLKVLVFGGHQNDPIYMAPEP